MASRATTRGTARPMANTASRCGPTSNVASAARPRARGSRGGTPSTVHSGADSNALEVRARGSELTFYINGQYVNRITDKDNFKGGIAGLYTSGTTEVAFDNLEISR